MDVGAELSHVTGFCAETCHCIVAQECAQILQDQDDPPAEIMADGEKDASTRSGEQQPESQPNPELPATGQGQQPASHDDSEEQHAGQPDPKVAAEGKEPDEKDEWKPADETHSDPKSEQPLGQQLQACGCREAR